MQTNSAALSAIWLEIRDIESPEIGRFPFVIGPKTNCPWHPYR
jgi:hypothetical protein